MRQRTLPSRGSQCLKARYPAALIGLRLGFMPVCPQCGQDNLAIAQFCLACGTRLRETTPARGEERKVVTVLFCDLVAFTTRSDRSDPEDVRATLSSYFVRLRRAVERHGGTVEKFIGDAVVAVFGAPVAHEDDPERAVRCAFAMLRAIDELNEEAPGLDLAVRIGITTGETLVALGAEAVGEGIVAGDVVNTAARLQEVAPVGGIVVAEATHRATRGLVDYEELEPVRVKGKAEPISLWRPLKFRSRYGADVDRLPRTPFIGRDDELELLKRTFARTLREPSVQLVTVMGEPGVGKSRLVREFFAHTDALTDLVHWRQGRCLAYGDGITYWAFSQIVKAHAGILDSDGAEVAADKLHSAVRAVVSSPAESEWIVARLGPLVGIPGATLPEPAGMDPSEMHTAWRRFLEAVASTRPLVLVFEDLHWADLPMLTFIDHLVEWSSEVPMLVLCTARPELYELLPGWGGGKRNSTTISLGPLDLADTAQLVSALLPELRLTVESEAQLLERAGGNPLYAEEFVQMLKDHTSPGDVPFPGSLHAIIAARLDALPSSLKALLQGASVIGKVFWSGALAWMLRVDEEVVLDGLHELTRRELVRPARVSSMEDQAEFGFWHVLIRDVAYSEIPRAARARSHRAMAEWIDRPGGIGPVESAELLAYHDGQALELARAAGLADQVPELEVRSLRSLVQAAEAAMTLDVGRAARLLDRALELVPVGHPDRGGVLARAAQASARCGRFEEAEGMYLEAVALAEATGSARQTGDAMLGLAGVLWYRGETERHRATLDEGIRLLEGEGPSQELTRAYADEAFAFASSGRLNEAVEWSNKALEMADELGLADVRAQSLAFRGGARAELGDPGGLEDLQEALRLTRDLGLVREMAQVHVILGGVLWATEGPRASLENLEAGIEVAERRGIRDMAMSIRAETLRPLFDLGDWDHLLEVADHVTDWFQAQGEGYFDVLARIFRSRVLVGRGLAPPATASDFLPAARQIGDAQVLVPGLAVTSLAMTGKGDLGSAVRLVEELDRLARDPSDWYLISFVPDLVRQCLAAGRRDVAERLLERMDDPAAQRRNCLVVGQALLAESEGHFEEASSLFDDSATRWRGDGFVYQLGQSLLGHGRCLARLGRPGAAPMLLQASAVFESLQAAPARSEVEIWLSRVHAGSATASEI
jgi:class 3 adenylate cyclase/tetratricopeptide (TPR) repeat protein